MSDSIQEACARIFNNEAGCISPRTEHIQITYNIPRQKELAQQFALKAKVSDDGHVVEVGSYRAKKMGILLRTILFANFDESKGTYAQWRLTRFNPAKLCEDFAGYSKVPQDDLPGLIAEMAAKESTHHVKAQDRDAALKKSLQQRLALLR